MTENSALQFFDAVSNWDQIEPHLTDEEFRRVLHHDFGKLVFGRYRKTYPTPGREFPVDWSDPEGTPRLPGPEAPYQRWVCSDACFWLVNSVGLRLATLVEPKRDWRIVYSNVHSTCWDGEETLWDFYGLCFIGDPHQAVFDAFCEFPSRQLPVRTYKEVVFAEHHEIEIERRVRGVVHGLCPWCGAVGWVNGNGSCCETYGGYMPGQADLICEEGR